MQEHIKRLAEEATYYADAMDGSGKMQGRIWSEVRDEYFAQAVARECAHICLAEDRLGLDDERAYNGRLMAEAIRARFGLEG